jgi:hypothetical protein
VNPRALLNSGFLAALVILGASGAGITAGIDRFHIYLQKKPIYPEPIGDEERILRVIPKKTASWVQVDQDRLEKAENLEVLGTDNYLTRFYAERNPTGDRPRVIELHAAYYTGAIDTVPHVPERCFTGAGMNLTGGPWVLPVPLDTSDWVASTNVPPSFAGRVYTTRLANVYSSAGGRRVNLPIDLTPNKPLSLRISEYSGKNTPRFFAGYFFVGNGGWVESAEQVRLLSFDLRQDYAYYMKIQVGSNDAASPEELAAMAASLFNDLLGELMTCIPDWMKVERGEWPPDNPKKSKPQDSKS